MSIPPDAKPSPSSSPSQPSPSTAGHPPAGYEIADARLRPILVFIAALFVAAALIHFGVYELMHLLQHHNNAQNPAASPFADARTPPTVTPLQPSPGHPNQPFEDMNALKAKWQHQLSTYGQIPGQPDLARIPIDRAIQITVERGMDNLKTEPTIPTMTRPAVSPATHPAVTPLPQPGGAL